MEQQQQNPAVESNEQAAAPADAKASVVDAVFDKITVAVAQGLTVAKRGLEATARWLDAQAKAAGELATKLGSA